MPITKGQETPLRIWCPKPGCSSGPDAISNWHHSGCGGTMLIRSNADVRCTKCDIVVFVLQLHFKCNSSKHGTEYYKATIGEMTTVLAQASHYESIVDKEWLRDLMMNLATRS